MTLLNKLLFVPSMLWTMVTIDNWYDRIDDYLTIGALPSRLVIDKLTLEENVKGVLSLNEKFELNTVWYPSESELESKGVTFLELPVEDHVGHATWSQAQDGLKFIDSVCSSNGTVYLHCKAGRYRSALMAATYIMQRYNATPSEAEEILKAHRSQISLHSAETAVLTDFFERMHVKTTTTRKQPVRPKRGKRRVTCN